MENEEKNTPEKNPNNFHNKDQKDLNFSHKSYCGLTNQGTTCYLNSLLQSLFMTPPFRVNILKWQYNEKINGPKDDCIMFQLQKLFARMQFKFFLEEETKDLTKSFQWDSKEIFQQHDIQELCRVLFDAIEQSLGQKKTFINDLYEGSLKSVAKCLQCETTSIKIDNFLDLSLPVRSEHEKIYNSSIEMALRNILKPEKLEKDNQYFCEKCSKKVDALKYICFEKLPKILIFQFNRFEYDFKTDSRRKVFDKVTFPQILNMNLFLCDYLTIIESKDQTIFEETMNDDNLKIQASKYLDKGPYVYDLYSIVFHSGNATGGHYYVYIKSFEDNQWYCFNDSLVTKIKNQEIQNVFKNSNSNDSSSTGYMLKYRRIDKEEGSISIDNSLISEDLRKIIQLENEKRIISIWKPKEKSTLFTFNINYDFKFLTAFKTDTIYDLKKSVLREYKMEGWENERNFRLRVISQNQCFLESFTNENLTLEEAGIYNNRIYSLEIKDDLNEFEEYIQNNMNIIIYFWDLKESDLECKTVKIDKNKLMSDLKEFIFKLFKIKKDAPVYCFKKIDISSNQYNLNQIFDESNLNKPINTYVSEGAKIYVEIIEEKEQSRFKKKFDDKYLYIILKFNSPIPIDILKNCNITVRSYKFDNQIEISKISTIKEVRTKISQSLGIKENEFIMKKFSHMGQELKNNLDTIDKLTNSVLSIYIEYGNPLQDNQIKLNTYFCEYDLLRFSIFPYKITELSTLIFENSISILELKEYLSKEIKCKLNINSDPEYLLVRENIFDKPGKIYFNDQIIKNIGFTDGKKICIQEYKLEKIFYFSDHIQVTVREWDPSNWTVSLPIEILIHRKSNFSGLINQLSRYFPHISKDNIDVYKLINTLNVFMDDFKNFKFDNLSSSPDSLIDSQPFFLNNDGNILIVKDNSKIPRDPTFEELKQFCRPSSNNNKSNHNTSNTALSQTKSNYMINNISSSNNYIYNKTPENSLQINSFLKRQQQILVKNSSRHKEKGLKIKVKKNKEKIDNKIKTSFMDIDENDDSEKKTENEKDLNLD